MKSSSFPHLNPKLGLGPREVRPPPLGSPPLSGSISHFASSSCPCPRLDFCSFFKNSPHHIRLGFSSPVNRPRHRSVFLAPHPRPQTCPYPLKELAVSVPGPTHFTSFAAADGGGGAGWAGPRGASGFSGRHRPCPAPPQDCVSVYNIYMYVLFPVLYGPCPLSGRPHKSSPQSLAAWFLDSWGWDRAVGRCPKVPSYRCCLD